MQDLLVQGGVDGGVTVQASEGKMRLLGNKVKGDGPPLIRDGTPPPGPPCDALPVHEESKEGVGSAEQPPSGSDTDSVYTSQRAAARSRTADLVSDADSWDDLEQNFARVYEPIPGRLRGRGHAAPPRQRESGGGGPHQQQVVAEVHYAASDTDSEFGETDYVTRSELYHNIHNLHDTLARRKEGREEDTNSWRSVPSQPDDPIYISRSEILSRVDPTYASRSRVDSTYASRAEVSRGGRKARLREATYVSRSEILSRLKGMREDDERSLDVAHAADASWDVCSCVSCEHCGNEHASASEAECPCSPDAADKRHEGPTIHSRTPSPTAGSLLSQDSWSNGEFEKIYEPLPVLRQEHLVNRTLEEQEKRLRNLVRAEEERATLRKPQYLPVDVWSISESEDVYESLARVARASVRAGGPNGGSQRVAARRDAELEVEQYVKELLVGHEGGVEAPAEGPVVQAITRHIWQHLHMKDFSNEEERNHEIRERLKEALAQDWETLSNINLGHIYVPMEDSTKSTPKLPPRERENTDYDTFGSIDSLIFEPKVATPNDHDGDSDRHSVDRLLDLALDQPYGDPALTAKILLAAQEARAEARGGGAHDEEGEEEEETPAPTPVSSVTLPESEPDHFLYDADEETTQQEKQADQSLRSRKKSSAVGGGQRAAAAAAAAAVARGRRAAEPEWSPRQAASTEENLQRFGPGETQSLRKTQSSLSQKDSQGYESFKLDFQRLSGERLRIPSEEDSTYDYHPDHRSPLDHGGASTTTTSRDTSCSETDSAASFESAIFMGEQLESEPRRKKFQSAFRHKFVVNRGNESDTSDLMENKSVSLGTHPYLDSDTSWDYMEAGHAPQDPHRYVPAPLPVPGPRVVANLRRKLTDGPEDFEAPQHPQTPGEAPNSPASFPSASPAPTLPPSTEPDEEVGRRLFRVYQRRQECSVEARQGGTSTTTTSHEYQDVEDMYDVCGRARQPTPPVVLLKHHVYQSIESLASRLSSGPSLKTAATDATLEEGELQMYGSRHGEPIYGVRNSRLFHSMNGAFVSRESEKGDKTPVVIRKGEAVELTEEMFKCGVAGGVDPSLAHMTFHTTLMPATRDTMFFHNTVSSTESREIHSYENDSEMFGARAEVCEEMLGASRERLVEEEQKEKEEEEERQSQKEVASASAASAEPEAVTVVEEKPCEEEQGASTDKIRRVQRLGVSITGNNDMMIRELKLKLRSKFSDSQEEEEAEAEAEAEAARDSLAKSPLMASMSSDSVAIKREQLAPHMNKILGSLHQRRMSQSHAEKQEAAPEICLDSAPPREAKEAKQEKNEKERETIRVARTDGGVEQVYVPTPDYTPASTLPRTGPSSPPPPLPPLYSFPSQDLSFDLADLAKFVHEHFNHNKEVYREPHHHHQEPRPPHHPEDPEAAAVTGCCVRFDMSRKLASLNATWSDLESLIFADEPGSEAEAAAGGVLPLSRMEGYRGGEGLLWEQLAQMRRSTAPEDQERWQLEKTKRMLLWIHLSGDSAYARWCHGSRWWKSVWPGPLQGVEHLKPGIVHRLANADLYCSALANIYGDPNFHNLSHWNIIQALARKGVYVAEPTDVALTETVLIQVSPIKMVVVAERVVAVLQRLGGGTAPERAPQDQEEALVLWVSCITQALQERIHHHAQAQDHELPVFPRIQDLSDLSDGIGLAALVAFYCPQELSWQDIAVADPPSIADSLYNVGLAIRFCQDSLPYNPCLLTREDVVYMHSSVKQNVLAFAAELFFLLELEPVSCVCLPGTKKMSTKYIQLSSPGLCYDSFAGSGCVKAV
ncbi:Patronin [Chionoecetes opilio]|uniref:Patronin n=1 Tax=Chionoecetes opilio TaxID=41210 RepID=A0A8J4YH11_CHIOP|nr:Patronin [Chionoecetes opilio]